ncbi:RNA polymerase sigma factor [Microbacterium album]|uniref:RNA polymerase sigma factor n=1 Tax=Microbacterium album TaxID=2053191 RepID=A0A917IG77_9MICO|nr:RNA polymerase sigma factor [Microbacterium album]GGH43422.1 RNA polymerase sigma factor [Microbacterium album]
MTSSADDGTARAASAVRAVEAVWRIESARIVATLTRVTGDFALAEDVAQEALAEALASWPGSGVPANPGAWLVTVGKRRAVDHWRRLARRDEKYVQLALGVDETTEPVWDPDAIEDDVLRLIFVACHPVLSREASIALTLRVVGGLTTEEIARAFLVPVATVQQRIVRAKKTLAAAAVPFEVPTPDAYSARLSAVLSVLYLIFNEGYAASAGPGWMRTDLSREALRLARVLAGLVPREPEAHGLVALMALSAARFPARLDQAGEPVLLADQDRSRWDRGLIALGRDALARADALGRGRGPYALQAAIAECHGVAPSVEETDWERIVLLYEALGRIAPSPVVELNRAVAVSMAEGPATALRIVDALSDRLGGYAQLPGVRAELLIRLGRTSEARAELERAARLTANDGERAVFERKLRALD